MNYQDNVSSTGNAAAEEKPINACKCKNPHIEPQWFNRSYICVVCGNPYVFDGTTSSKLKDVGKFGEREIGFNPEVSGRYYNFDPRIILKDGTVIPVDEFKKIQHELEFTSTQIEGDKMKLNATLRFNMLPFQAGILAASIKAAIEQETKELNAKALGFNSYEEQRAYEDKQRIEGFIGKGIQAPREVADRPDWDTTFMEVAKVVAKRGTCPRLQVGAVITSGNKIISTGYNGAPAGTSHCTEVGCLIEEETGRCKRTVHAEVNAIIQAGVSNGCDTTLYTTEFPCIECASIIANSNVDRLVYIGADQYDTERYRKAADILSDSLVDIQELLPF